MNTVRTLGKLQRGLKGQQAGKLAEKALALPALYQSCTWPEMKIRILSNYYVMG
jgi:hypothetical protein